MAASMQCRGLFLRKAYKKSYVHLRRSKGFSQRCASTSTSYYVLLPEIPPDTENTNPVMCLDGLPQFSKITADNAITGCAKLAIQYETGLGALIEDLQDQSKPVTFDRIFEPLEKLSVPLTCAWRTSKNLSYAKASAGFGQAFQKIHPTVERAKNERWISHTLYNSVQELVHDPGQLSESEARLAQLYLLEARLNGAALSGDDKAKFLSTLHRLSVERTAFRNRVMVCQNMFSHGLQTYNLVKDLPPHVREHMAEQGGGGEQGPWKVTLSPTVYSSFLERCPDRTLRWNIWQAQVNRASPKYINQNLSNHKGIDEIRFLRRLMAEALGYENFAELAMETKMAGSVQNVMSMLESLRSKFRPAAEEDLRELTDLASAEGHTGALQSWDVPYWRWRHRQKLFGVAEEATAKYFPLDHVLSELFSFTGHLFGIHVKEAEGVDVWHPDVRCFSVSDAGSGEALGTFYLDALWRPQDKTLGTWMEAGRDRSVVCGVLPVSYLNMNLMPRGTQQQPLLTLQDLTALFQEFGQGLQQLLTTAPHSETAGQRSIEWDALQVCSLLMRRFLLTPAVLRRVSRHVDSGDPLTQDEAAALIKDHTHMYSLDMVKQLYYCAYDMEMYVSKSHWFETIAKVWPEYVPIPLHEDDCHPASLTQIFSDQYAAAYYCHKWAEMVAADVFSAFEQAGLDNGEAQALVGARLRGTLLSLGGSVPAGESFRRFMGRDPSFDALLLQNGLHVTPKT